MSIRKGAESAFLKISGKLAGGIDCLKTNRQEVTHKTMVPVKTKFGGNEPLITVFAGQCHQKELSKKPQSHKLFLAS
jgi:hypothetical protein